MKALVFNRIEVGLKFLFVLAIPATLFFIIKNYDLRLATVFLIITFSLMFGGLIFPEFLFNKFGGKIYEINREHNCFLFNDIDINKDSFKIMFSDIISYQIYFPSNKISSIKFLKNGNNKVEYSFFSKKNKDKEDVLTILEFFHKSIQDYNEKEKAHIKFLPSFTATKTGLYVIIFLCILCVVSIILSIIFVNNAKNSFTTSFVLISFILVLIGKRRKDIDFYNKWNT
jgi:hypothetical protein